MVSPAAMENISYIPVTASDVPISFRMALDGRTYLFAFDYNEHFDFFTCTIATASVLEASNEVLVSGEPLRYGMPLFYASPDERLPSSLLIPLCLDGDDISRITYENFGKEVLLCIFGSEGG